MHAYCPSEMCFCCLQIILPELYFCVLYQYLCCIDFLSRDNIEILIAQKLEKK